MSTRRDVVLSALTDEPQGRVEIAEATGLEAHSISQELTILAAAGLAERRDGGWCIGPGEKAEKVRKHEAHADESAKPTRNIPKVIPKRGRPKRAPADHVAPPPARHHSPIPRAPGACRATRVRPDRAARHRQRAGAAEVILP